MVKFKTIQFEGIGTHWWIDLPENTSERLLSEIKESLLVILNDFDQKYSRFKESSLVSKLNKEKVLIDFPDELYEMLIISENIKDLTGGHFNVCIGTHLENLGYDSNYSFESKYKANSNSLNIKTLTKDKIEISPEARIDLGGIGKGWLINKFKNELEKYELNKFVINGGGDIYVYDDRDNNPYKFALENPFDNAQMIGTIEITTNEAIACSSPSRRSWRDKSTGKTYHHLVDFNSGENTKHIIAVFTQGESIINSDLASTAIFLSEINLADKISRELNVEYLIIFPNGEYKKSKGYKGILNQ